jgi:hypothetical protein
MIRSVSFLLVLLGGCAGQPQAASTPPAQPHKVKVDASNVVAVQHAGYKLVDKNGQQLYCRTEVVTGSRINSRTTCLTEQELNEQVAATQQAMKNMPPPVPVAGH